LCATLAGYFLGLAINKTKAQAQERQQETPNGDKILEKAPSVNDQVKFTEIKNKDASLSFGTSFAAEGDWLKDLTFGVKNIADKPIIYLSVRVNFPDTKSTGNMMSYPIVFGQRPNSKIPTTNAPLQLMPGKMLEVALRDEYAKIAKFVETRQPMNSLKTIQLEIGFIIFEDGLAWAAGDFLRQDPNNPNRYHNIGPALPQKPEN
jgi:hypothetical protein